MMQAAVINRQIEWLKNKTLQSSAGNEFLFVYKGFLSRICSGRLYNLKQAAVMRKIWKSGT